MSDSERLSATGLSSAGKRPLTLVELLTRRALDQPEHVAYTYLRDDQPGQISFTYAELDQRARAIAAWLQPLVSTNDRVLLLYPPGLDYIATFFGCLYAGAVAVPAYPPKQNRSIHRLQTIVADAQAKVALTTAPVLSRIATLFTQNPYLESLRWATLDSVSVELAEDWHPQPISDDTLAFLQYTSGSTSAPKGVMLTHRNLLCNAALAYEACEHTPADSYVSWLPTFHDLGFMAGILQPLYGGFHVTLMSPAAFLQRPVRWLEAITRYRATTSGGPNFAYDLCARKVTAEDKATLDLSSWTIAFNGSEPIRAETLDLFTSTFAPVGFRREAFYPGYGLAEATLMVTGSGKSTAPLIETIDARALELNRAHVVPANAEDAHPLVSCGKSLAEQRIIIVNPDTLTRCEPDEIGEIWIAGGSVAQGYWNRPEETAFSFQAYCTDTGEGPFLRTGDLGFLREDQLFVTGRLRDLIIIRGLNHYPQDIEQSVEQSHPSLRKGCGAAFSIEAYGEERLVIVQEVDFRQKEDFEPIIEGICQAVAEDHEIQVYAVVLIKHGSLPKTSSGKVQRHACRKGFLERSLTMVAAWRAEVQPADEIAADADAADLKSWLAAHFKTRLGVTQIDFDEPMSRYRLDSLAALELKHELEKHLGVTLPMVDFLQSYSITNLAAQAHTYLTNKQAAADVKPVQTQLSASEHPLSHGQQALWFLQQLAPESSAYNLVSAVRIQSELNVPAFRAAFQALVERHLTLRTTFHHTQDGPFQRVHDHREIFFVEDDATEWDEEFLEQTLIERANHPFDLEADAMLRVNLFRRSAREHVLLINVHHIVADFWSLAVLIDELGVLYDAEIAGTQVKLNPLVLQYFDYARWQTEMLSSAEGERLWSYWEKRLGGEVPNLELPTDRPRPPVQTFRGASHIVKLPPHLGAELRELSRVHGATLYMTLLSAFQVLLFRYTNQQDILVGSPTGGRDWAALAGVVGYFVNPVVVRSHCSGESSFEEFLGQVRESVLEALRHQDYPFSLLVERLQPTRDPGRSPLFQALFSFQKTHLRKEQDLAAFALGEAGARLELGSLTLESIALDQRVARFDLTLMVAESEGDLTVSLEYNTDLFDAETAARLLRHYEELLSSVVNDPTRALSELTLLSDEERHQLVVDWNATATEYPADLCCHEIFARQAALTPQALAVSDEKSALSYAELDERSNRLAQYLKSLGVGVESPVGVFLEREASMLTTLLGILKAGGAYVPLDPSYPAERLAFMLEDSSCEVVVTRERLARMLPSHGARPVNLVKLDTDKARIEAQPATPPGSGPTAENLAYVIYTSGSTGKPKGVMIEHRSLVNLLSSMLICPGFDSSDTLLAVTTLCFDIAGLELFLPLMRGAGVAIASRDAASDGLRLAGLLDHFGATLMQATPATWRLLLNSGWIGRAGLKMLCGGEALATELARQLAPLGSGLWNMYGPTETTIWSAIYEVKPESPVLIGRPLANTQFYLLGDYKEIVPLGVVGELYIGGDGLARGYLNRPELTAERFLPDPFSNTPGARLYRTGDLARYLPGGNIEFLGRVDEQVKVRGFRIEPGEVEAALREHGTVAEAVVMAREDEVGEKRLVAYVVGKDGEAVASSSELRRHLQERLPEYLVPTVFVALAEIPLTANGKIDRRRLPAPAAGGREEEYAEPRTPVEELLAGVWAEVLNVERVGVRDDFFELGGHSLLATQVISRVREVFGVELALRTLFETPTVEGLGRSIEEVLKAGAGERAPKLERVKREEELPLSFAQQRLWFLDQLEPDNAFYNIPLGVQLTGRLDVNAVEQTLSEVIRRHEVLRTRFKNFKGTPVQIIEDEVEFELPILDLSELPEERRNEEAHLRIEEEARQPFDLTTAPLLRARLLKLADEEHILLFTIHHIVSDGWSMGVLIREVSALYAAFSNGQSSPLPELSIQYADYAAWQRNWLQGEVLGRQLQYWRRQLGGELRALKLPTDRPRLPVTSFRGARESFVLPADLTSQLAELSRRENVTLFMALLAAFQVLLQRYSGRDDICVGVPLAGRNKSEIEGLIGIFVNMLPIRTNLSGDPRFNELLGQVRETTLDAYAHQDVPFEKLVEELQPERTNGGTPFFQVAFGFDNAWAPRLELAGLKINRLRLDDRTVRYDLTLWVEDNGGTLSASWTYRADLFNRETIARMHAEFEMLLQSCVARPSARVSTLETLTPEEKSRRLREEQALEEADLRKLLDVKRRRGKNSSAIA